MWIMFLDQMTGTAGRRLQQVEGTWKVYILVTIFMILFTSPGKKESYIFAFDMNGFGILLLQDQSVMQRTGCLRRT
jgi:hypothetical protein